jgi:alanyl-tRNA synthetase
MDGLLAEAEEVEELKIVSAKFADTGADTIRAMCDRAKEFLPNVVCIIAGVVDGKVTFAAACGADAVKKGAHAGNLVREVAKLAGGSGGGKPDSAMAGATNVNKVNEALDAIKEILHNQLNK